MENFFSLKGKGIDYCSSTIDRVERLPSEADDGSRYLIPEDFLNDGLEIFNFDACVGYCNSPSMTDQIFGAYALSPLQPVTTSYVPVDGPNFTEQNNAAFLVGDGDVAGISNISGENNAAFLVGDGDVAGISNISGDGYDSRAKDSVGFSNTDILDMENYVIPRQLEKTLPGRLLQVLSFLKESSKGGILAQVWVPIKLGNQYILSTREQPYLLDQMLAQYREVSRAFTFSADAKSVSFRDLPGRVFFSKIPEWTSNIVFYTAAEYSRIQHGVNHEVRGAIALPIFEDVLLEEEVCCAVLELITTKEKPNFDLEIENVSRALKAVNLRTTAPPRLHPQFLSKNKRAVLAEITDCLRFACHAHRLPLALVWIPCSYTHSVGGEITKVLVGEVCQRSNEKIILCIEETTSYANDREMQGFVHTCMQHYLDEGQGVAGKALQSNQPFFFPDVKQHYISEYPLVHHARKFGLNAAVAIRLRSTFTNDDDYVLEFFLPIHEKRSSEQTLLLNHLSCTLQRVCKSLRSVSDAELGVTEGSKIEFQKGLIRKAPPVMFSRRTPPHELNKSLSSNNLMPLNLSETGTLGSEPNGPHEQTLYWPSELLVQVDTLDEQEMREVDGIHNGRNVISAEEKVHALESEFRTDVIAISYDVLKQHFGRKLEDAAESLRVSRSTMKRICRQHGILRWPSHKRNKSKCSLSKSKDIKGSTQAAPEPVNPASFATGSMPRPAGLDCTDQHTQEQMSRDLRIVTIKTTYGKDMIKFRLSLFPKLVDLEGQVAKRLKLNLGTFCIKYQDDDNDWILIACNEDLQDLMDSATSTDRTTIRLLVEPNTS